MIFDIISNPAPINIVITVFSYLIMFILATPFHECAHGYMAKWLGDPTAAEHGRLTMNPIKHMDLMGTIGLLVFGVGWAKPVPVSPRRARKAPTMKVAMALTAAAGPLSNFLLALIFILLMKILVVLCPGNVLVYDYSVASTTIGYLVVALNMIANINLRIGVFNLIMPIPPFDGSRIILSFLPTELYFKIMRYERYILIIVLVLLSSNILAIPFGAVSSFLYNGIDFITSFIC